MLRLQILCFLLADQNLGKIVARNCNSWYSSTTLHFQLVLENMGLFAKGFDQSELCTRYKVAFSLFCVLAFAQCGICLYWVTALYRCQRRKFLWFSVF